MAAKILVCFAGPLDGQRVSVSSYMKKVKDGQGGCYYRKKFERIGKEALIYGPVDLSGLDLEIINNSCNGNCGDCDDYGGQKDGKASGS